MVKLVRRAEEELSPRPKGRSCGLFSGLHLTMDAWGFLSPSPFSSGELQWSSQALYAKSMKFSLGLTRPVISNLVSQDMAEVGLRGWSFKNKCSIAILANLKL